MRKILHDLRDVYLLITLKLAQPLIVGVKKPHRSPCTLFSTNCRISEDYAALTFLSIVLLVAKRLRASARSRGSRAPLGADRQVRGFYRGHAGTSCGCLVHSQRGGRDTLLPPPRQSSRGLSLSHSHTPRPRGPPELQPPLLPPT